jgi:hypothetical protein
MKKIFTLLFAVGMFAVVQAQPGTGSNRQPDQRDGQKTDQRDANGGYDKRNGQQTDQRDVNSGYDKGRDVVGNNYPYGNDDRYDRRYISPERKRDMQIAKINQEYDYKIQRVRFSFFMNRFEKQRQIRLLEGQRQREIEWVYIDFKSSRNRHDDHDYPRNRHY